MNYMKIKKLFWVYISLKKYYFIFEFNKRGDYVLPTKNIVPRADGEGGFGRVDKPWGSIYANDIPYMSEHVNIHNSTPESTHIEGISGNAASASGFYNPVRINTILFRGDEDISIPLANENFMDAQDVIDAWNTVWEANIETVSLIQSPTVTDTNNAIVVSDVDATSDVQHADVVITDSGTTLTDCIGRVSLSDGSTIQINL